MKKILLLTATIILGATIGAGQDSKSADPQTTPHPAVDGRGQLMREIGLTPEQFRDIRRINLERKPLMEAAQLRLREANRLLDEAIYSDSVDEAAVEARLKEAQSAQAEVFQIRSASELAIRKILTPEQLVHFRDLRRRFEEARRNIEQRRIEKRNDRNDPAATPFRGGKRLRPFVKQSAPEKQP